MPDIFPWRVLLLLSLWLGLAPVAAGAEQADADSPDDRLKAERWSGDAFGISMRPPRGTQAVQATADNAVVKFAGDNTTYSFYIRRTSEPVKLKQVRDRGVQQFTFTYPNAVPLKDPTHRLEIAGRKAFKLYFLVGEQDAENWVGGQAYMLLDPTTVAVFQLQCAASAIDTKKTTFEQMLRSVRLEDPKKLDQQRKRLLKAGQRWREQITPEQLKQALPRTQWFRIKQNGKDVGYMRWRFESEANELAEKGVRLRVRKRVIAGKHVFDTDNEFFLAYDGKTELWSIRSTRRLKDDLETQRKSKLPQRGQGPKAQSSADVGVRAGGKITVNRQTPTSIDEHKWPTPPTAYLSQLAARVLMRHLPHNQPRRMLFYAYHPESSKLALRHVHVRPLKRGRFKVRVRPAPGSGFHTSIYNADGRLIRRKLPNGRVIEPATKQEMRRAWNLP